jgi:NADPH2:quinone reductase
MRAAFYTEAGPAAKVLQLGDLETPTPSAGEVRVRLRTSGVNPSDVKARGGGRARRGLSFPLVVPHSDGAGDIDLVGAGVPPSRAGERVWVHNGQWKRAHGTAAEYIVLPNELVTRLPANVDYAAGACLGIPALTAYRAVTLDGPVEGQTLLIAGGAGAVGHYAIQIAKAKGALVITTVSSSEKANHVKAAGADYVIDYRTEDVGKRVKEIAGGGVDRIIEVNLSANAPLIPAVLRPFGTVVVYGSDQPVAPVPAGFGIVNSISFRFFIIYEAPLPVRQAAIADLTAMLVAGRLIHTVAARFPLDQIAAAHEAVESGKVMGNVVVDVW